MIAAPNKGIDESILDYCYVLGSKLECRDMDENSLFINKLNYDAFPTVKTYNIIGQGCAMDGETGDGIVRISSAKLDNAENYYVNGSCSGISFLHENILNPENYPEAYRIISESLKKSL